MLGAPQCLGEQAWVFMAQTFMWASGILPLPAWDLGARTEHRLGWPSLKSHGRRGGQGGELRQVLGNVPEGLWGWTRFGCELASL